MTQLWCNLSKHEEKKFIIAAESAEQAYTIWLSGHVDKYGNIFLCVFLRYICTGITGKWKKTTSESYLDHAANTYGIT